MNSLANTVAGQDPVHVTGSWQRHLPAKFRDRATEGRAARSRWGRDSGFPILYLGRPTASVIVEAYRHLVDPIEDASIRDHLAARVLVTVDVAVHDILDLRTSLARLELGITLEQITSATDDREAYAACYDVAAAAHQQGFHGLVAPAATGLGETLALFSNRLTVAEAPTITRETIWETLPADPRSTTAHLRVVRDD